jgi:hypothetical protein
MFLESEEALNNSIKDFYENIKDNAVVKGVNLLDGYKSDMSNDEAEVLLYNNVQKGLKENKFTLEDVFELIPKFVTDVENIQR